jgi:alpha-beta hydrolase superfamily lysophospholipase
VNFTGAGGLSLFRQEWLPDGEPRAVVVIAHGAGEHSGRYGHVAARLTAEGYAVHALDHRGHGRSDGPRALIDRMDNAVADLDTLVTTVSDGEQVFLLGHSMGGAIALEYAIAHQERLKGLALSGPLAALEAASPAERFAAKLLSAVVPRLGLIAVDASLVSRDPAVVEAYKTDPLVHHGKLPARTIAELASAVESFPDSVGAIIVPTLIMYGTADQLVPPKASVMLEERIGASELTVKPYQGLYHEIFNEPEQQQVLDDLAGWLNARVGAVTAT